MDDETKQGIALFRIAVLGALIGSELDGKPRTAWVKAKAVSDIRPAPTPSPDCTAAVAAERERIATGVLAVIRN